MKDWKTNMQAYNEAVISGSPYSCNRSRLHYDVHSLCHHYLYSGKRHPESEPENVCMHYTSDNVSMTPAIINTILMVLLTLVFAARSVFFLRSTW